MGGQSILLIRWLGPHYPVLSGGRLSCGFSGRQLQHLRGGRQSGACKRRFHATWTVFIRLNKVVLTPFVTRICDVLGGQVPSLEVPNDLTSRVYFLQLLFRWTGILVLTPTMLRAWRATAYRGQACQTPPMIGFIFAPSFDVVAGFCRSGTVEPQDLAFYCHFFQLAGYLVREFGLLSVLPQIARIQTCSMVDFVASAPPLLSRCKQVAAMLVEMFAQCGRLDYTLANAVRAEEQRLLAKNAASPGSGVKPSPAVASSMAGKRPGAEEEDGSSSDEDDDMGEEDDEGADAAAAGAAAAPGGVDPDGWATVSGKKTGKGRRR